MHLFLQISILFFILYQCLNFQNSIQEILIELFFGDAYT